MKSCFLFLYNQIEGGFYERNLFMDEIIEKEEGWANFIGIISVDGKPKTIKVVASCSDGKIQYFDANNFEPVSSESIYRIVGFTFSTSKRIEEIIQMDLFFVHAEKESMDKNTNKILYYQKKDTKNEAYNIKK